MRPSICVKVSESEKLLLKPYRNAHTSQSRMKLRAQIILALGSGIPPGRVRQELGISTATLHKWKNRWNKKGIEGLTDLPRPGNRKNHSPEKKAEIVSLACSDPGDGRKRRTHRQIAALAKVSTHSVWKTLKENDLKPHQTDYW